MIWTPQKKRHYHQERRRIARLLGLCQSCATEPAKTGRTKCHGCLMAAAAYATARRGLTTAKPRPSRYTPAQRAQMHHYASLGESRATIALRFGCHQTTITRILSKPQKIAA